MPRVEGTDFSRIVAFTDGVFAVAITLLVLSLEVPQGDEDLARRVLEQWPQLFAYFLTFAVVGRLWIVHHQFFASLGRFDGTLVALNLLYLSLVALVPFTTNLLGDHADDAVSAVIYAAVLGLASAVNLAMARHALRAKHLKPGHDEITESYRSWAALVMPGVFLASIPVALFAPHAAELMWIGVAFRPRQKKR